MAVAVSFSTTLNGDEEHHMIPTKITSTGELSGIHESTWIATPTKMVCASELKDGDYISRRKKGEPAFVKIKNVRKFISSQLVILADFLACAPLLKIDNVANSQQTFIYAKDFRNQVQEYTFRKEFDLYNMVAFDVEDDVFDVGPFTVKF